MNKIQANTVLLIFSLCFSVYLTSNFSVQAQTDVPHSCTIGDVQKCLMDMEKLQKVEADEASPKPAPATPASFFSSLLNPLSSLGSTQTIVGVVGAVYAYNYYRYGNMYMAAVALVPLVWFFYKPCPRGNPGRCTCGH